MKRQREKQYNSAREQRDYSQIRSSSASARSSSRGTVQRALPFGHCALTMLPVHNPICNRQGIIFENSAVLPFVMKYKVDPASGEPLELSQLITLNVDRGDDDDQDGDEAGPSSWQCPVLTKQLTGHTKVVAVLQKGGREANVYSYQAYHELNVKPRNYVDLTTSEPFDPKTDVILLNDPENDEWIQSHRVVENFYHVRHGRELGMNRDDRSGGDVRHSKTAQRILEQLKKSSASSPADPFSSSSSSSNLGPNPETSKNKKLQILASDVLGVEYTAGRAATSFTSTAMAPLDVGISSDQRLATEEEILQSEAKVMKSLKKKGYVRLHTSISREGSASGDEERPHAITLELHCDVVPRTCINFLGLCREGRYDGTIFHRLIPSFMVQGGKAPESPRDVSFWGDKDFPDEFDDRLKHAGRGVVSMANSGPNTNRQQFFITFKSCPHLDRKHSVFGRVVNDDGSEQQGPGGRGASVLDLWESTPVDKRDRPKWEIRIVKAEVLVDPALEAQQMEEARFECLIATRNAKQRKFGSSSLKASGPVFPGVAKPVAASATAASSVPAVGRYLQDRLRPASHVDSAAPPWAGTGKDSSAGGDATSVPNGAATPQQPKNRPPLPSKTSFGNFNGW